jgi:hypothetical protein
MHPRYLRRAFAHQDYASRNRTSHGNKTALGIQMRLQLLGTGFVVSSGSNSLRILAEWRKMDDRGQTQFIVASQVYMTNSSIRTCLSEILNFPRF